MSCERCGGFKVFDYFDGPFHCSGYRCINCGAITDMRIAMATQTRTVVPPRRIKPVGRPSFAGPLGGAAHPVKTQHQPLIHPPPRPGRFYTQTGTPEGPRAEQLRNQC